MNGPSLSLAERLLWFLNIGLSAVLVGRFIRLKFAHRYRFFVAYLVLNTSRSVVAWSFSPASSVYRGIWKATEPAIWLLYVLAVLEVCFLIFKDYRGIRSLGRRTVYGGLAVSTFVSSAALMRTGINPRDSWIQPYLMIERGIDFALVVFLLLILAFLAFVPIPLSRNVIIHCVLYSIFFISNTIGILIVNVIGYRLGRVTSASLMGISVLCLAAWLVLLRREGEAKIMVLRKTWTPSDEEHLLGQMAKINAVLLGAARSDIH
jgi:hypothetical protein